MLETLALMGQGFVNALVPVNILAMAAGTTIGIVIGCLPGLSAAMGVALLLPMTFTMEASTGLIVLGAIYCGAIFGGSISAILIHTPRHPRLRFLNCRLLLCLRLHRIVQYLHIYFLQYLEQTSLFFARLIFPSLI